MGIHGLTTYLRDNTRALATTTTYSSHNAQHNTLVVDAWSFIYALNADAALPWVYGGDYPAFVTVVAEVVSAWRAVGLEPLFVFDGPYPPAKITTAHTRLHAALITPSLLFFRTSPAARNTPRFLKASSITPPLLLQATLAALHTLSPPVALHFADAEADAHAVALAARLGACVAGMDSDFVVLNAEGYAGYVPLDEMVWSAALPASAAPTPDPSEPYDDGFQPVKKPRSKTRAPASTDGQRGLVPPLRGTPGLELTMRVYTPAALAAHLSLPSALLPLLGALVGNDFTSAAMPVPGEPPTVPAALFPNRMALTARIALVAKTLAGLLALPPAGSKVKTKARARRPESVLALIRAAVDLLLGPLSTMSHGARARVVERVVEGTLAHAIAPDVGRDLRSQNEEGGCNVHGADGCALVDALMAREDGDIQDNGLAELGQREEAVRLYLTLFRRGLFSHALMDSMVTRTSWPGHFLEDPDRASAPRVVGRWVRRVAWAVIEHATGAIGADEEVAEVEADEQEKEDGDEEGDEEEDEDELIGVVESQSDSGSDSESLTSEQGTAASLRMALLNLRPRSPPSSTSPPSSPPAQSLRAPMKTKRRRTVVTEYVRIGSRIVPDPVPVPSLRDVLEATPGLRLVSGGSAESHGAGPAIAVDLATPLALHAPAIRLAVLRALLGSDTPAVRALPSGDLHAVLAVRTAVRALGMRAREGGAGKEREKDRWTTREARAAGAALAFGGVAGGAGVGETGEMPAVTERGVQLAAQLLAALEAVEILVHALALGGDGEVPGCASRFSGMRFHQLLALEDAGVALSVGEAVTEGLDGEFSKERMLEGRRGKKARRREREGALDNNVSVGMVTRTDGGRDAKGVGRVLGAYGLLAELDDL